MVLQASHCCPVNWTGYRMFWASKIQDVHIEYTHPCFLTQQPDSEARRLICMRHRLNSYTDFPFCSSDEMEQHSGVFIRQERQQGRENSAQQVHNSCMLISGLIPAYSTAEAGFLRQGWPFFHSPFNSCC